MMKTIVFFSSPHKNGNTAQLLDSYVGSCAESVVTVINLYDKQPHACIDCGYCKTSPCCSLHDFDEEMRLFEQADTVVFAFPIYNCSFPAPMKALFDRFQVYYNARFSLGKQPPIQKKRNCAILVTCGRRYTDSKEALMSQIRPAFTVLNLNEPEIIVREQTDLNQQLQP